MNRVHRTPEERAARRKAWERKQSYGQKLQLRWLAVGVFTRVDLGWFSVGEFEDLIESWGHRCAYCGAQKHLTADHIIPLSKDGRNEIHNIVPACGSCNSSKQAEDVLVWAERKGITLHERVLAQYHHAVH